MKVDIIVGATWGEEGKSKFARYYSDNIVKYDASVKVGGYCTNTFYDWRSDQMMDTNMIPAVSGYRDEMYYFFPRDCYVDLKMLNEEATLRKIPNDHIVLDPFVQIMYDDQSIGLLDTDKAHIPYIIADVSAILAKSSPDTRILVEGQGGYGLAKELQEELKMPFLLPSMTASGICHLLNIAPTDVDDVILVTRLENFIKDYFGGPSTMQQLLMGQYEDPNYVCKIESPEITPYNFEVVKEAIFVNDPSVIVVNHMDSVENGKIFEDGLTDRQNDVLKWIEKNLGVTVDYVGYSESQCASLESPETFEDIVGNDNRMFDLMDKYNLKAGDSLPEEFVREMEMMTRNEKIMIPRSRVQKVNK